MGRTIDIAEAEIISAAQSLLAKGKRVTGWALREAVGGRGKPERMFQVWTSHRDSQDAVNENLESAPEVLPVAIEEMATELRLGLTNFCDKAWRSMYRSINATLAARHDEERLQLEALRGRFEEDMAGAAAAVESADSRIEELLGEVASVEAKMAVSAVEVARFEERLLIRLEQAEAENKRLTSEIGDLARKNESTESELLSARIEIAALTAGAQSSAEANNLLQKELELARQELVIGREKFEIAICDASPVRTQLAVSRSNGERYISELKRITVKCNNEEVDSRCLVSGLLPTLEELLPIRPDFVNRLIDPKTLEGAYLRHLPLKRSFTSHHDPVLIKLGIIPAPTDANDVSAPVAHPNDGTQTYSRMGFDLDYGESNIAPTAAQDVPDPAADSDDDDDNDDNSDEDDDIITYSRCGFDLVFEDDDVSPTVTTRSDSRFEVLVVQRSKDNPNEHD